MNKTPDDCEQLRLKAREERKPFLDMLSKETDRGLAIVSVCYLDNMLEKLIRAAFRKDPRIKILFNDNQILQSFHNKVCIAYFSGLIPESFFDDLKLVGEIRNKFAHSVLDTVSLNDVSITQKLYKLKQLPPEFKNQYPPRLAFMLVITHMGSFIQGYRDAILKLEPMYSGLMCNTDLSTLQSCILKPLQIKEYLKLISEK